MRHPALVRRLAILAMMSGCGEPAAPDIPDLSDGSLQLFGVLVAESDVQVISVSQTDSRPITRLDGTLTEVADDGSETTVAVATPIAGEGTGYDLVFAGATIEPGRRYRVTVTAPGRPEASAVTTVPADFDIDRLEGQGDPPGSEGLGVEWTPSAGAFRYIVTVGPEPDCVTNAPACETFGTPWAGVTAATRIDTVIPATAIPPGRTQGVEVAVYAVNRELFEYFTTGVGGPFTVQPKQNVEHGYGSVGAWVRRVRTIRRQ